MRCLRNGFLHRRCSRQQQKQQHRFDFIVFVVICNLLILQLHAYTNNVFQPKLVGGAKIMPEAALKKKMVFGGRSTNSSSLTKNNVVDDSAALRELKEMIQKQAAEITELKKEVQLRQTNKVVPHSTSSSSHHGGGGDVSLEELSLYLEKPFYLMARKRVGWLSLFLCSLSLTAVIMSGFEHTLSRQIELAYFVPLLAGHGGNTGGQTVGTVLSAISSGSVQLKDAPRVIAKEAMSGLMVGIILGICVGPIAHYVMGISVHVSAVILCTLPLVSAIAATLGSAIPFFCLWAGLDPSVIAAPAMTSFVDVSGLMSYFIIANQIFHMFGIEL